MNTRTLSVTWVNHEENDTIIKFHEHHGYINSHEVLLKNTNKSILTTFKKMLKNDSTTMDTYISFSDRLNLGIQVVKFQLECLLNK